MTASPFRIVILLAVLWLAGVPAAAAPGAATIVVHADRPGATIDRNIYGQFSEHLGAGIYGGIWVGEDSPILNTRGFRDDVIAALKDLHVPVVRWPGGCFADEYHWRDGIGLRASRPVRVNHNWGGVPESNAFGTHEYFEFLSLIGAQAYISVNVGTGSVQEMADWLEYIAVDQDTALTRLRRAGGRDMPWRIALLGIGNETWGCGGNMTAQHNADLFNQYAAFVRLPKEAMPKIIASGDYDEKTVWTEALAKAAHGDIDGISFHYYTVPSGNWDKKGAALGFGAAEWDATLARTLRMEGFIAKREAILDRLDPKKKIGLYVDEWGTWYDTEPGANPGFLFQQNSLRDAVVAALNLNIFQRHAMRVRMAAIAQTVNVLQAMILTDGPKMVLTPTYHVFHMYRPFQEATVLPVDLKAARFGAGKTKLPQVSVSAARAKDGKILLALVNLDPARPARIIAKIAGVHPGRVAGEILTAGAMDAHNSFDDPAAVHPVAFDGAGITPAGVSLTLPPKSVVVLELD
jgi:alpha-L-arabinofuranosidase